MGKNQKPNNKRGKPNKQKAARIARGEKQALESLAQKRHPFEPLLRDVVASVLYAEGPKARTPLSSQEPRLGAHDSTWVEVGCGLGQLRALLPTDIRDWVIHTDVSEWLVRGLLDKFPDARALTADVVKMPFETGSVDALLGLCVFDSFPDPTRAATEIARVLRPGGRFIHFLDAATNIEPLLLALVGRGRLPLPNFFADILVRRPDLVEEVLVGHLVQPYHDVVSVPLSQFTAIAEMLQRAGHQVAAMLDRYLRYFLRQPFELLPAARAFVELTSNPEVGRPMNQALMSLYTTLQRPPYSEHLRFDLESHSSLSYFKTSLEQYFGSAFGFELRYSSIVYARAYEPNLEDPLRARVRRVGIGQNSLDWPAPQGVPAQQLKPDLPSPEPNGAAIETHVLRESAMYCLVSERCEAPGVDA